MTDSPEDIPDKELKKHFDANDESTWQKPEDMTYGDWFLRPGRPLSPRHRRLAEYASSGMKNKEIAERLGLTESRVSILKSNSLIMMEIKKIQERLYEESHQQRLKAMGHDALDIIHEAVLDDTNKYKASEKLDTSKWILEKVTGKAVQIHDVGENMLAVMMDRLDAMKNAGANMARPALSHSSNEPIDVTPIESAPVEKVPKSEEDLLKEWVDAFSPHK